MPSKNGFGNTRKKAGKASYGSAMHYKNPIKKVEENDPKANLLKAVPNEAAYNLLSDADKKGFDKAAKKAGLPQKRQTKKS